VIVCADLALSDCECGGPIHYACLPGNTIGPYRGYDYGCGRLRVSDEEGCGQLYLEDLGLFLLDGHGSFADGDSIHVTGNIDLFCGTFGDCSSDYCMEVTTIEICSTPPAVRPTSWGELRSLFR
jgi:hypothetical protein